jgi:hypothetical protein
LKKKVRVCFSCEEKEEVKVEKLCLPREGLALPFYQTRGQATLVKREEEKVVVHAQQL